MEGIKDTHVKDEFLEAIDKKSGKNYTLSQYCKDVLVYLGFCEKNDELPDLNDKGFIDKCTEKYEETKFNANFLNKYEIIKSKIYNLSDNDFMRMEESGLTRFLVEVAGDVYIPMDEVKTGLTRLDGFVIKTLEDIKTNFLDEDVLLEKTKEILGNDAEKYLGDKGKYGRYSKAQIFVLDRQTEQVYCFPLKEEDVVANSSLLSTQNGFNYVIDKMVDIANSFKGGFNNRLVFQFVPSSNGCFCISGLEGFKRSSGGAKFSYGDDLASFLAEELNKRLEGSDVSKNSKITLRFAYCTGAGKVEGASFAKACNNKLMIIALSPKKDMRDICAIYIAGSGWLKQAKQEKVSGEKKKGKYINNNNYDNIRNSNGELNNGKKSRNDGWVII